MESALKRAVLTSFWTIAVATALIFLDETSRHGCISENSRSILPLPFCFPDFLGLVFFAAGSICNQNRLQNMKMHVLLNLIISIRT